MNFINSTSRKVNIVFFLSLLSLALFFPPPAFAYCVEPDDGRPTCNQCTYKRMVEADEWMVSTEAVIVDESNPRFISFMPVNVETKKTALAIFHGGDVDWSAYSPMAHWAAESGYKAYLIRFGDEGDVCAAPPNPISNEDIDDFLDINANQASQWVFAGHSLGGVTASYYMNARKEERSEVKGIVYWASYTTADLSSTVDLTFLSGDNVPASKDGINDWEFQIAQAVNFPNPTQTECIVGGNHAQYGWYGAQDGEAGEPDITRADQQEKIRQRLLVYLSRIETGTAFPSDNNTEETAACQDIFPLESNHIKKK